MKPKISLLFQVDESRSMWFCSMYWQKTERDVGFGHTPKEAYDDWINRYPKYKIKPCTIVKDGVVIHQK
jgi:hypothetical protein